MNVMIKSLLIELSFNYLMIVPVLLLCFSCFCRLRNIAFLTVLFHCVGLFISKRRC